MKKPFNESIETFLSLIKYFLIFIFLNNLIWAVVYLANTSTTESVITQDDNYQGENNGTINNG